MTRALFSHGIMLSIVGGLLLYAPPKDVMSVAQLMIAAGAGGIILSGFFALSGNEKRGRR